MTTTLRSIGMFLIGLALVGFLYGASFTSQSVAGQSIYQTQDVDPYLRMLTYKRDMAALASNLDKKFAQLDRDIAALKKIKK